VSAMAATLRLEIVTPEAVALSEDVDLVTLPGFEGQIGIYPGHVRLLTRMLPGELAITKDGHDTLLAVGEGLVAVAPERVEILTDLAVRAEDVDEAMVEEARQRAAARLQERISDESIAMINASLVRALTQLQVRRRPKGER
jgi:F-type H+-transporting ATPase subunit epsilon